MCFDSIETEAGEDSIVLQRMVRDASRVGLGCVEDEDSGTNPQAVAMMKEWGTMIWEDYVETNKQNERDVEGNVYSQLQEAADSQNKTLEEQAETLKKVCEALEGERDSVVALVEEMHSLVGELQSAGDQVANMVDNIEDDMAAIKEGQDKMLHAVNSQIRCDHQRYNLDDRRSLDLHVAVARLDAKCDRTLQKVSFNQQMIKYMLKQSPNGFPEGEFSATTDSSGSYYDYAIYGLESREVEAARNKHQQHGQDFQLAVVQSACQPLLREQVRHPLASACTDTPAASSVSHHRTDPAASSVSHHRTDTATSTINQVPAASSVSNHRTDTAASSVSHHRTDTATSTIKQAPAASLVSHHRTDTVQQAPAASSASHQRPLLGSQNESNSSGALLSTSTKPPVGKRACKRKVRQQVLTFPKQKSSASDGGTNGPKAQQPVGTTAPQHLGPQDRQPQVPLATSAFNKDPLVCLVHEVVENIASVSKFGQINDKRTWKVKGITDGKNRQWLEKVRTAFKCVMAHANAAEKAVLKRLPVPADHPDLEVYQGYKRELAVVSRNLSQKVLDSLQQKFDHFELTWGTKRTKNALRLQLRSVYQCLTEISRKAKRTPALLVVDKEAECSSVADK